MLKEGDRVSHRYNQDLGPGLVVAVEGRQTTVLFPENGETLHFAAGSDALAKLVLRPGGRARHGASGDVVEIEKVVGDVARLADGRELPVNDLWPVPAERSLVDRLSRGEVDSFEDFRNRLDGLRLVRLRQADGLGSFLGGRIRLFPHQLYAAERATESLGRGSETGGGEPVRWLLADEVGLGKTVEACLIMNRLLHRGLAERTLVVAPDTLTVQWLGELWRKHHQVFVLLDEDRLKDVARDHGGDFNPFDVYRRAIVSHELLASNGRLAQHAVDAGIDLLVVDEAHRVRRKSGHPGNPLYRTVRPVADLGRHVLLLSATPLEDDALGFFRLLQLLRPDEFPEDGDDSFHEHLSKRLASRTPLPPCTSATRREDVGGLPPRVPVPVEIDDDEGWGALDRLFRRVRGEHAKTEPERRRKVELLRRAASSPVALPTQFLARSPFGELAADAEAKDPRVDWLAEQALTWRRNGDKTLVFVSHRETLEHLKERLGRKVRVGIFHEDLSAERRDMEVAQFRLPEGPGLLVSTEAGGEGRNFEFCDRLVLFDLPWNPEVVEQRIGRLDRIGRDKPTRIVYFRPPEGFGRTVAELYEEIGLFREALGSLQRELMHVGAELGRLLLDGPKTPGAEPLDDVLREATQAKEKVREAAYQEMHRDPYRAEYAPDILGRVPARLDDLNRDVVMRAAARFGFETEPGGGKDVWVIEYGVQALVDHLPGVPPGRKFLGTFDRGEAVANEGLEFFASGHPLVEGILAELEDGRRGRVAMIRTRGDDEEFGILALYKDGESVGEGVDAVAVDARGKLRPDLAATLTSDEVKLEQVDAKTWSKRKGWLQGIRKIAQSLPSDREPVAVAAFRIRAR